MIKDILKVLLGFITILALAFCLLCVTNCAPMTTIPREYPTSEDPAVVAKFIDQFDYKTDKELYGHNNYFASPSETYENWAGDCDDFAIAFVEVMKANTGKVGYYNVYWIPRANAYHMTGVVDGYEYGYISGGEFYSRYSYNYMHIRWGYYAD
jgi:transglutaminase-like putative cysteine protease